MFIPSKRLLWLTALVIVPAWFVLGVAGVPLEVLMLAGAAILGLLALDAITSMQRLNGVEVTLLNMVRTSKEQELQVGSPRH